MSFRRIDKVDRVYGHFGIGYTEQDIGGGRVIKDSFMLRAASARSLG
jgi:hypothetical protein